MYASTKNLLNKNSVSIDEVFFRERSLQRKLTWRAKAERQNRQKFAVSPLILWLHKKISEIRDIPHSLSPPVMT